MDFAVNSTSGNINLVVEPDVGSYSNPNQPGRLVIRTISGSVSVTFLQHTVRWKATNIDESEPYEFDLVEDPSPIQYRPYEVEIYTETGSISGNFIFTTKAHLQSESGSISASFTLVVSSSYDENTVNAVSLETKTTTGSRNISLTEPLVIDSPSLKNIKNHSVFSSHTSISGSIDIEYPQSWASNVTMRSSVGLIAMDGDGLEVTDIAYDYTTEFKNHRDEKQRGWWGSRGDMDVQQSSQSGPISFHVKESA